MALLGMNQLAIPVDHIWNIWTFIEIGINVASFPLNCIGQIAIPHPMHDSIPLTITWGQVNNSKTKNK